MRFAPRTKLALHPQFSAYMAGERVYPINIEVSPSGVCNASCEFCFYANTGELGHHRKVFLDYTKLATVLEEAAGLGVRSVSWTGGGDPSLHPQIGRLVEWVSTLGMKQGMFTNALAEPKYDPRLLDWIRVTMTDKPYRQDVIAKLRACPTLGFAFNYSGPKDDDYLMDTLLVAERVQADYVQVRPALKFHGQTTHVDPPTIRHPLLQITEYKFEDARKEHGYRQCEGYHFVPFLWEDGNVDTCSYMRNYPGYTLGNVYERTLKDILDSAPASVPVHEKCQVCCRNHEHNKSIHESREIENKEFP